MLIRPIKEQEKIELSRIEQAIDRTARKSYPKGGEKELSGQGNMQRHETQV